MTQDARELARKYALQNAVRHGGSANPKAILGKILGERADLRSQAATLGPVITVEVDAVNAMSTAEQKAQLESMDAGLLESKPKLQQHGLKHLPGWQDVGEIVMRFAPNPNGPATIGHSRGMAVHAEYQRMYEQEHGKNVRMILRFDDTDPSTKPPIMEAYDAIRSDFEWMGGRVDQVVYASDRIAMYHEHGLRVLEAGQAYVCTCDAQAFRELKNEGTQCPCRDGHVETNRARWDRMHAPDGYAPGEAVLRIKTDIRHKDPALRDWVAFRIIDVAHPRVGHRWRVWPLLDFESAVEDHETGVTHIIRGKDLIDSQRKQAFLYGHLGWEYPRTLHWGRIEVHGFGKVSKSLILAGVAAGEYSGWDDVRLPTLAALRRRGFQAAALRRFWIDMGLTEKDVAASYENLAAANVKSVEADADRLFFVPDPVTIDVSDLPDAGVQGHAPVHPDHPGRGIRRSLVGGAAGSRVLVPGADAGGWSVGQVVRLKDWGNLEVTGEHLARYVGNDMSVVQQGAPIVQWLSDDAAASVVAQVWMPDAQATVVLGRLEAAAADAVGRVVQFERVGYVRLEDGADGLVGCFAHA